MYPVVSNNLTIRQLSSGHHIQLLRQSVYTTVFLNYTTNHIEGLNIDYKINNINNKRSLILKTGFEFMFKSFGKKLIQSLISDYM